MIPHAWLGIGARQLAAFEAVARLGSFGAAGRELGYGQPAISQQVAALERIVGEPLVERTPFRAEARPTPAGAALLPYVREVLGVLASASAAAGAVRDGALGTVRLGSVQSTSERIVPALLGRLAATAPGLHVEVVEGESSDDLERQVVAGGLDAAFAMLPLAEPTLVAEPLLDEPFVLLLAAGHPLAGRPSVTPAEVAALDVVGLRSCRAQAQVESALALRVVGRHDDHGLIHGRVAEGAVGAVLPLLAVRADDSRVRAVPVDPAPPPRRLVVARSVRPGLAAVETVIAAARAVVAEVVPPGA